MKKRGRQKKVRFTMSLAEKDHDGLIRLAESQTPPVSASYVGAVAIRRFLESMKDPQQLLDFEQGKR